MTHRLPERQAEIRAGLGVADVEARQGCVGDGIAMPGVRAAADDAALAEELRASRAGYLDAKRRLGRARARLEDAIARAHAEASCTDESDTGKICSAVMPASPRR